MAFEPGRAGGPWLHGNSAHARRWTTVKFVPPPEYAIVPELLPEVKSSSNIAERLFAHYHRWAVHEGLRCRQFQEHMGQPAPRPWRCMSARPGARTARRQRKTESLDVPQLLRRMVRVRYLGVQVSVELHLLHGRRRVSACAEGGLLIMASVWLLRIQMATAYPTTSSVRFRILVRHGRRRGSGQERLGLGRRRHSDGDECRRALRRRDWDGILTTAMLTLTTIRWRTGTSVRHSHASTPIRTGRLTTWTRTQMTARWTTPRKDRTTRKTYRQVCFFFFFLSFALTYFLFFLWFFVVAFDYPPPPPTSLCCFPKVQPPVACTDGLRRRDIAMRRAGKAPGDTDVDGRAAPSDVAVAPTNWSSAYENVDLIDSRKKPDAHTLVNSVGGEIALTAAVVELGHCLHAGKLPNGTDDHECSKREHRHTLLELCFQREYGSSRRASGFSRGCPRTQVAFRRKRSITCTRAGSAVGVRPVGTASACARKPEGTRVDIRYR